MNAKNLFGVMPGNSQPAKRGNLIRLIPYIRGSRLLIAGLGLCILTGCLLDLTVPWIMSIMLLDGVIQHRSLDQLPKLILLLAAVFLAQKLSAFLQTFLQELANQRVVHRLRCKLYEHIQYLSLSFFEKGRTGELLSRLNGDVDAVEGLLSTLSHNVVTQCISFAGTLYFLYMVNPRLTLFVLPTLAALAASVFFLKRRVKRYSRYARALMGEMAALAGETLFGIRVVKAFSAERFETRRFMDKSQKLLRARVDTAKLSAIYSSAVDTCVFAGTLIVIAVATPWVVSGVLSVGVLVAYLAYLNKLYGPAKELSKVNLYMQKIGAAAERIFEILDETAEQAGVESNESGMKASSKDHYVHPHSLRQKPGSRFGGLVRFNQVSFSYDRSRPALKDFSMEAAPGDVVALVGHSGAGKTTIVNLLLRFYEPASGRILIDEVPCDQIPLADLRRQIALVPQETFLFSGTIRDNIGYGNLEATDRQIEDAARAACAHDFIMRLPRGYHTQVGEQGVKLSGGQRQRIAIARAFVRNPAILIFDEATSHLDTESEELLQRALGQIAEGRTVFVIAHRLSTIRRANKIVVLEDGELIQAGSHQELMAASGVYRRLFLAHWSGSSGGPLAASAGTQL